MSRVPFDLHQTGLICGISLTMASVSYGQIFLPGTQPEENGIEFAKVQQCIMCHSDTKNGNADPYFSWHGGMMAQAARDPIYLATLAIANQDVAGVGEYCVRCHAPRGWLEGRSKAGDTSMLNREDLHGVSCDVCHSLVDPRSPEAATLAKEIPPGFGNSMMVADHENVARGPYGDGTGAMPHKTVQSPFHASSELCGTCHNVSNPLAAEDVRTQQPFEYGVIERTYSEWLLSDFANEGAQGTCQSCHYPAVEGGGQASRFGELHREHFVMHGPLGGSTWVQGAIASTARGSDVSRVALRAGQERARAFLKTAASLDVSMPSAEQCEVRVTNLTGHKLPTGYPEGRRMWVNVRFIDANGKVLAERGAYGTTEDTLSGEAVTVPTLLDPDATTVYECLPGISDEQAAKFGKQPGKSFHFVLNDMIVKDNRIPPRGFSNEAFARHLCAPIGVTYADGQYWDDVKFDVPQGTARITVRLMYQSMSWEYLKFLVEENSTTADGKTLYDLWSETGQCPPEVIAEAEMVVSSTN